MKPQYFGDIRDLFKFDLSQVLIGSIKQLKQIYYIPMLTENDRRNDGKKVDYSSAKAGGENTDLIKYLRMCITNDRRNIREIGEYYRNKKINIEIYRDTGYLKHTERRDYFVQANKGLPDNSLILVDPDNGMEVKRPKRRHILYSEIKTLYNEMSNESVLMIYQHFPRIKHNEYIKKRFRDIGEHIKPNCTPCFISDNDIIFFLLTKIPRMGKSVEKTIIKYNSTYKDLYIDV